MAVAASLFAVPVPARAAEASEAYGIDCVDQELEVFPEPEDYVPPVDKTKEYESLNVVMGSESGIVEEPEENWYPDDYVQPTAVPMVTEEEYEPDLSQLPDTYQDFEVSAMEAAEMMEAADFDITQTSVKNLAGRNDGGDAVITWDPVAGVTGYVIYYRVNQGDWGYRYLVTTNSYTDTNTDFGLNNDYRVYPYIMSNGTRVLGKSTEYVTVVPKPAEVTRIDAVYTGAESVSLSWDAAKGAGGYVIYRKTGTETAYSYLYLSTGTSYTDAKASADQHNLYKVYGYRINSLGNRVLGPCTTYSFAVVQSIDQSSMQALAIEKERNALLRWNPVGGAHGYLVYYKRPGDAEMIYDQMVGSAECISDKHEPGVTYEFIVYPFRKIGGSNVSSGKAATASITIAGKLSGLEEVDGYSYYYKDGAALSGYLTFNIGTDEMISTIAEGGNKKIYSLRYFDQATKRMKTAPWTDPNTGIEFLKVDSEGIIDTDAIRAGRDDKRTKLLVAAFKMFGEEYEGDRNEVTTKGKNCSQFVSAAFYDGLGSTVFKYASSLQDRASFQQYQVCKDKENCLVTDASLAGAKPGDVVFWHFANPEDCFHENCKVPDEVHHVGIYIGNNQVIESAGSKPDGSEVFTGGVLVQGLARSGNSGLVVLAYARVIGTLIP